MEGSQQSLCIHQASDEALKGASNGGYHYLGSAKIFAQMGQAFAEANLKLIKN